jgi:hypothetical protein
MNSSLVVQHMTITVYLAGRQQVVLPLTTKHDQDDIYRSFALQVPKF